ncbi:Replication factor C, subunit RFC4 [Coemansia sp. RSA 552]|nr:Replication factor C, subunit RFC4 [Coemansia sp. RSA 552]
MASRYASQKDEMEALDKAIQNDSMLALGVTFVGAGILSAVAYKFSPGYRSIPISAKTALILAPAIGAFYVRGEHVGTEFRRSKHLQRLSAEEQAEVREKQQALLARQSLVDRSITYVNENRWSILGYTWLTSMAGSIYYLYRQKGMTVAQKAVQARMYAQLITIAGILSTAAIASLGGKSESKHQHHNSAALDAILAEDENKIPIKRAEPPEDSK